MSKTKATMSEKETKTKIETKNIVSKTKCAADEDLAVKPIHPLIDYSLGGVFLLLCSKLALMCWKDQTTGFLFLSCLVAVIVVITGTRTVAQVAGRSISKWRNYDGLPEDLRDPLRKKLQMRKFKDQSWQLLIHLSMTLYELYLLRDNDWFENPASAFTPCPSTFMGENPANKHSLELRLFYLTQLAIWIWTCFSCQFLESRRKDYLEMMLHHIFTISLVLGSYLHAELPIGLVVLFIHDVTDIFVDSLKICNYLKLTGAHGFFITELVCVANVVSWVYFRLYKFPLDVVYRGGIIGYANQCATVEGTTFERCQSAGTCLSGITLLTALVGLHLYWFMLFLRILVKIYQGDSSRAGKEHYEGHSDASDDEAGKLKSS